jgi:hypothetical protein
MTHARILPAGPGLIALDFAYDEELIGKVKGLPGASFNGDKWRVPALSLPALKAIFATLTVEPAVLVDYYRLLRAMLEDFAGAGLTVWLEGSQVRSKCLRKGQLGPLLAECIDKHRAGIAAVLKQGAIVAPARVERPALVQPVLVPEAEPVTEVSDPALEIFLKGVKNAQKKADQKEAIAKNSKRRKKKQVA